MTVAGDRRNVFALYYGGCGQAAAGVFDTLLSVSNIGGVGSGIAAELATGAGQAAKRWPLPSRAGSVRGTQQRVQVDAEIEQRIEAAEQPGISAAAQFAPLPVLQFADHAQSLWRLVRSLR